MAIYVFSLLKQNIKQYGLTMETRLKEVDWFKNNLEKNKLSQVWNTTLLSKRNTLKLKMIQLWF